MKISRLHLVNFKNYLNAVFEFSPKYNAVVGLNGMGKTNLLDAIYFTCMTKSNFVSKDQNLINEAEAFMRVDAKVEGDEADFGIVCKFERSKKKIFEFNKKPYDRLSDHVGKMPVVFIVPKDQSLITDGSKERRKLLDNTLCQLDKSYLQSLYAYNALLNQRNAYLKIAGKTPNFNPSLPKTYAERMQEHALFIHQKRTAFVENFSKVFSKKYLIISQDQEKAACEYKSQLNESEYMEEMNNRIDQDRFTGRTTFGIHKDDVIFRMDGKSVKYFASQGQTKSFVISIKLSQYELISEHLGIKPILLLDDLFDKLDNKRVEQLIELLEQEEVDQVFISDTDEDRIVNILGRMNVNFKKFVINSGKSVSNA